MRTKSSRGYCNFATELKTKYMNTVFTVKNFRVFDENGVDVQLSPITILTGCNSSGKSSIVKAVLLLDSFLKQIKRDYEKGENIRLDKYRLDFNTYPNNQLGRYDKIVNNKSESKRITFAYTIYSLMLSKDINVEFVFNVDKNDELNNGFLEIFTLSIEDGVIYSSGKTIKKVCNLNLIKDNAIKFILAEYLIQNYSNAYRAYEIEGSIPEEDLNDQRNALNLFVKEIDEDRFQDMFKFIRYHYKESIARESGCKPEVLEWTFNNESYFFIPLVEKLKDCTKANIKSNIVNNVFADKKISEQLQEFLDIIVKDFSVSNCHTFGEYFFMKETEFMENTVTAFFSSYVPLFDPVENSPSVNILDFFDIPQHYFEFHCDRIKVKATNDASNIKLDDEMTAWIENKGIKIESREENANTSNAPLIFPFLYELLMTANNVYTDGGQNPYYKYFYSSSYVHYAFRALGIFARDFVMECVTPIWSENLSYVSSSRIDVKRLYSIDDMNDFTQLLQKYFEGKRAYKTKASVKAQYGKLDGKEYVVNSFTNIWLKRFGIGESLLFDVDKEGLGVKIFLHRNDETEDRLLADEGYGITQLVSIILQIETAILTAKGERERYIYGFNGQDNLKFHYEQQTIAIEEPEIHLHPRLQSLLAEMFVYAYKKYNIHFIIETHSEYLIRKMQLLVSGKMVDSDDISLLYVYDSDESRRPEGESQIKDIGICSDGYLNESFGSGFFDEASSLSRQLLK